MIATYLELESRTDDYTLHYSILLAALKIIPVHVWERLDNFSCSVQ